LSPSEEEPSAHKVDEKIINIMPTNQEPQSIDFEADLNELQAASSAYVIDFFKVSDPLSHGHEKPIENFEVEQVVRRPATRRRRSTGPIGRIEESFYWLISATVLMSMLFMIFELSDARKRRVERTGTEQLDVTGVRSHGSVQSAISER
jgi:hypothetical protein